MVERKIERNKLVRANANLEPRDKVSLFQCVALFLDYYYYCYY